MRFSELLQNHLAILERLEPHGHRLSFDRGLRRQAEHQARGVFARPGREALDFVASGYRQRDAVFEGHILCSMQVRGATARSCAAPHAGGGA